MDIAELVMIGIIGAGFLGAFFLSFFLASRRIKWALALVGALWSGFTAFVFFGMYNATGWDAIGYAIFLIGINAPTGLGSLIGGLVGWAKSGNEQDGQSSPRAGYTDTAPVSG